MSLYIPTKWDKKAYEKMDICILSPIMHPKAQWIRSISNMIAYSWMNGLRVYELGFTEGQVVDWARGNLAKSFLTAPCSYTGKLYTHALWSDDDQVFGPDMMCVLARHFGNPQVDMVSAVYYRRTPPPLPCVYLKNREKDDFRHYPIIVVPETLGEIDACGFGGVMMRRELLERVPEPWFTIDWQAGEDIAFCVKAKQHGARIFVDGAYKMGHVGFPELITEENYRKELEVNKEKYSDKLKYSLDGKILKEDQQNGRQ
jgi:hypothetical protein